MVPQHLWQRQAVKARLMRHLQAMRVDMEKQWRGAQTRGQKLRASLATRLPRSWPPEVASMFLAKAESTVAAAWRAAPPPPQKVRLPFMHRCFREQGVGTIHQSRPISNCSQGNAQPLTCTTHTMISGNRLGWPCVAGCLRQCRPACACCVGCSHETLAQGRGFCMQRSAARHNVGITAFACGVGYSLRGTGAEGEEACMQRSTARHNDDDHDVEISELTEAEDSDATGDDDAPASRGANGRL